jgi:hypothetical protein
MGAILAWKQKPVFRGSNSHYEKTLSADGADLADF